MSFRVHLDGVKPTDADGVYIDGLFYSAETVRKAVEAVNKPAPADARIDDLDKKILMLANRVTTLEIGRRKLLDDKPALTNIERARKVVSDFFHDIAPETARRSGEGTADDSYFVRLMAHYFEREGEYK